jgi:hypothetical protein
MLRADTIAPSTLENLQRAWRNAERLAERLPRRHPVDHLHGNAVALQFGSQQQADRASADDENIHVFHSLLLTFAMRYRKA